MRTLDAHRPMACRVMLVELGGAGCDVLVPLAESGVMPNVARLMRSAATARLHSDGPYSPWVTWATLQAGGGLDVHGMLDDRYLDHRRGRILSHHGRTLPCPTLGRLVTLADPQAPAVQLADVSSSAAIGQRKPSDFQQLSHGITRAEVALRGVVAAAEKVDRSIPWRLLQVRFAAPDWLLHHLWHLLGIGDSPGGKRKWVAKTRQAFRTWDDCLGELLALAGRRGAAVVLVSAYGFGPFREKITLSELLRRRDLLLTARGAAKVGYRMSRLAWRVRRWLEPKATGIFLRASRPLGGAGRDGKRLPSPCSQPVGSLLPIDWRRTRAVTLHGRSAALVYLNTPERFGTRVLVTARQREQAAAETTAALSEARHPVTGERLFVEVYLTEARFGGDPLDRYWPEVVAIPAAGFHTRHRPDRNRHLLRTAGSLAAARTGGGSLMLHAPGVAPGPPCSARLIDVAPTILDLLGLEPAAGMAGRRLRELFVDARQAVDGPRPIGDPVGGDSSRRFPGDLGGSQAEPNPGLELPCPGRFPGRSR